MDKKSYKSWDETDKNLIESRVDWVDTGRITPADVKQVAEITGRSVQAVVRQVNRMGYAVRRKRVGENR